MERPIEVMKREGMEEDYEILKKIIANYEEIVDFCSVFLVAIVIFMKKSVARFWQYWCY
jgi:hypothetical protein